MHKFIQEVVCYHQGKYIEYEYLVSEKHKALKEYINTSSPAPERTKELMGELETFAFEALVEVLKANDSHVQKYFEGRSPAPRSCIKTSRNESVVDIWRRTRKEILAETLISKNTGFDQVVNHKDGSYWYCPDIPALAKQLLYENPRLDPLAVASYVENGDSPDYEWVKCWFNTSLKDRGKCPPEACYKSTIIVPMTLMNNLGLTREFKETFFKGRSESYRYIWGFLCFDNHTSNFFDESKDVSVGYVLADLLSLYFVCRDVHISFSKTYKQARGIVGGK